MNTYTSSTHTWPNAAGGHPVIKWSVRIGKSRVQPRYERRCWVETEHAKCHEQVKVGEKARTDSMYPLKSVPYTTPSLFNQYRRGRQTRHSGS